MATITNANLGTFTFEPPPGQTGTFTLAYRVTDNGNPPPGVQSVPGAVTGQPGVITITVSGPVTWFVDSSAPGGGNGTWTGTNAKAFQTLAQADAVNLAGDRIFVINNSITSVNYAGNLGLTAGERLIGQGVTGVSFDAVVLGGSPPAGTAARPGINGTRPTLQGTTTLADGVTVTGVNFAPIGVPAMSASGLVATVPITIDMVNVTGGTSALSLTTVTASGSGAINVSNASFLNTSAAEVLISGGNVPVTLASTATISSNAGRSVDIQNRTGGAATFNGAITDTSSGVFLNANGASAINFTGGLSLTTGANPGFTATNGGTVSATQNNTSIVNTIATTTGTALNVANTTIGASGLTFRSIASNGATNGILLNASGAGGLTVTGNSAGLCGGQVASSGATVTAPAAADCSGGVILASTGAGVSLTSTGAVSLTRVRIANGGGDGITGSGVAGLTLTSSLVENNGNAVGERGIDIINLTGTGGMANSTVRGSAEHNVVINNTSGTLSSFNVTNSQFSANSIVTGDDGIQLLTDGAANLTASITQSAFTDNKGDHFQAATTASATGTINVTFSNNTLLTTTANDPNVIGGGITISPSGAADLAFTIANNNIQQAFDDAINLNLGTASTAAASLVGTIANNTIGTAGDADSGSESSNTITVTSNGAGTTTVAVTGNVLRQYGNGHGILLDNKEGSSTLNATVTGNNIDNPGTFAINGIHVSGGATSGPPADSGLTCAAVTGNTVINAGLGTADIRLRQRFATTIRLPGYAGAANDTTAVNIFVAANNGGPEVTSIHNVGGGGFGYVGGAACPVP